MLSIFTGPVFKEQNADPPPDKPDLGGGQPLPPPGQDREPTELASDDQSAPRPLSGIIESVTAVDMLFADSLSDPLLARPAA